MSENEGADPAPDADATADPRSTDDEERPNTDEDGDHLAADEMDGSPTGATVNGSSATDEGDESSTADDTVASSETGESEQTTDSADEAADAGSTEEETITDGDDSPPDTEATLVNRVEDASADQIATEINALRERVASLEETVTEREETIEELESKLKRKQADFQNFKKRQKRKKAEEQQRATEDLVERLLDVRDNLVRALDQEEGSDIRGGVESTLRQFDRVFDTENVQPIDPDPGTDVDPGRHEVLMRVESDQDAGTVADIHRPGYEMAGKVLRPAQVTVAEDESE